MIERIRKALEINLISDFISYKAALYQAQVLDSSATNV